VTVDYTPTGSGDGILSAINNVTDFAGSDAPASAAQYAVAPDIQFYPAIAGAIVVPYSVPSLGTTQLILDRVTLARIFVGNITSWQDPAVVALNPSAALPAATITVVIR
jgi:phosphate transport system substrate-binding protein